LANKALFLHYIYDNGVYASKILCKICSNADLYMEAEGIAVMTFLHLVYSGR